VRRMTTLTCSRSRVGFRGPHLSPPHHLCTCFVLFCYMFSSSLEPVYSLNLYLFCFMFVCFSVFFLGGGDQIKCIQTKRSKEREYSTDSQTLLRLYLILLKYLKVQSAMQTPPVENSWIHCCKLNLVIAYVGPQTDDIQLFQLTLSDHLKLTR